VKKVIEATSRPAAKDAHAMASSGGELSAATAAPGSAINPINQSHQFSEARQRPNNFQ
jgi:hypothetical protein